MKQAEKARIFRNGRSQAVRIPLKYRFTQSEVFIQRNPQTGVVSLSEKPFPPSMEEIFARFDEAGGANFTLERDRSLSSERESL